MTIYLFGVWSIFLIVSAIIRVTLIGIIQKPTIKYLIGSEDQDSYDKTFNSIAVMAFLFAIICAVGIIGYYMIPQQIYDTGYLSTVMLYFIPQLPFWVIFLCIQYSEQAHFKYKGTVISAIAFNLLFLLGVLYLIFSQDKLVIIDVVLVQLLALIASTLLIAYTNRQYYNIKASFSFQLFKEIFQFTRYVAFANMLFMLKKNLDTFILNIFYGPNAVAVYQTALKMLQFFELPNQVISQASFPKSVAANTDTKSSALKNIFEQSVGKTIIISLLPMLGIFIGADYIIELIGGFNYRFAATHLRILLIMVFIYPVIYQFGTILDSQGKSRLNYYYALLHLIIILIVMPLSIYFMGEIGASVGLIACNIIIAILHLSYLRKTYNIELGNILKKSLRSWR